MQRYNDPSIIDWTVKILSNSAYIFDRSQGNYFSCKSEMTLIALTNARETIHFIEKMGK